MRARDDLRNVEDVVDGAPDQRAEGDSWSWCQRDGVPCQRVTLEAENARLRALCEEAEKRLGNTVEALCGAANGAGRFTNVLTAARSVLLALAAARGTK